MTNEILLERRDYVATITFNRPNQRNAIRYEGWLELRRLVEPLAVDNETRVVVFTGRGPEAFSAGADIKDFDEYRGDAIKARIYQKAFDGAINAIEALPIPTICLIKGFCIGGGCELTLATDLRVAADNARFAIPAAKLGIVIGYEEMRRLIALIGPGHASYLLMSGRLIEAKKAEDCGLVNAVVPLDDIDEFVAELASEISQLAPLSHKQHKQIMNMLKNDPQLSRLTPEQHDLPFQNFDSEDFAEGRRSFLERRKPKFKGR